MTFSLTIGLLALAAVLLIALNAHAEQHDEPPEQDWRDAVPDRWRIP